MGEIKIESVSKDFTLKTGLINQLLNKEKVVSAVKDVSLEIKKGEIISLVGESGCGKTTLGRMLVGIEDITSGEIIINGKKITKKSRKNIADFHKNVQMIFQDPFDSLNPKMTIFDVIAEPLISLGIEKEKTTIKERVYKMLETVDLVPAHQYANRYPHRLSGGQRQRVAIARALIVKPTFIVADEPVSMLDVSIRAGILNLLKKINEEEKVSILMITHDLATAKFVSDKIAVMYLGNIVEVIDAKKLTKESCHPYTQLLLSAVPDLYTEKRKKLDVSGEAINAVAPPKGCRYVQRCPFAEETCKELKQHLKEINKDHYVACWKINKILKGEKVHDN